MAPVAGSRLSPAGNGGVIITDQMYGGIDQMYGGAPPCAVRLAEYGAPTMPSGSDVVVIMKSDPTLTRTMEGLGYPASVNHTAPSGPVVIAPKLILSAGVMYSVNSPAVVIRPIVFIGSLSLDSVNHNAPSGPAVIAAGKPNDASP